MKLIRIAAWALALACAPGFAAAATEIVFWNNFKVDKSPRGQAMTDIVSKFEAKNPDIKVRVETVPFATVDANLIQGAAAGNTPDVIKIYNVALSLHVAAGSIQPLDQYLGKIDKTDWLLPWDSTVFDGKKYALPSEYRFFALMYRKDVLDKAGVQVPTTWDEMCKAAGTINSPQVMGYGFGLSQSQAASILLEWADDMALAAGGSWLDDKGRAIANNPAGLKFMTTVADLVGKCKASSQAVVGYTYEAVHQGLAGGTIAMAGMGTHRYEALRATAAKDNLRWAPPPSFEKGKAAPVHVLGWTFVMGKHTKHPEAAIKFMEYMTSPEVQVVIAKAGEMPTRKSTYNDPWFKTPEASAMRDWAQYIARNGKVGQYPSGWLNFGQILASESQGIVLKGVSPAQALANVVERYNKAQAEGK
ncbi:MAG TPA: sugar ABC transporter substrate-binding protein [Burkholderiales bacterium]|nr:sugar ABC transporter substrate-binding protein [Burkholderiales bacterium]